MASIARVKCGDIVECDVKGERFFAVVESDPVKVSPRVHEINVKLLAPGHWQRHRSRYEKVRGRAVVSVYRKLKS